MIVSAQSDQYVSTSVAAVEGGAPHNPSADPVAFAFLPRDQWPTQATVWQGGVWEAGGGPMNWSALCLVGPSGVVLAPGTYSVYLRVTDSPEVPVLPVGYLSVQ